MSILNNMPMLTATPIQERRRFARGETVPRLAINLLQPPLVAGNVNISEGGLCLRLAEHLEVRSLIQMEIAPERASLPSLGDRQAPRSVQCTGRVSWVMQRLDLRDTPPFLFDVGIEFVNPSRTLRQWLALPSLGRTPVAAKQLLPVTIRGRSFSPQLERVPGRAVPSTASRAKSRDAGRWHLVVTVGGVPCFSQRYASRQDAERGWAAFKRQQARARS